MQLVLCHADKMLSRAHSLIENYKKNGISSDRILIRLPATWQGIQAAKQLEQEGIASHVTLIYRYCIQFTQQYSCFGLLLSIAYAELFMPAMSSTYGQRKLCSALQLRPGSSCSASWRQCDPTQCWPHHGLVQEAPRLH